jgi:outer membrane murein-binding lipoprotein Lpp
MFAKLRSLACAVVGGWLLTTGTAAAQPHADAEEMERLERQVELLQKQLKAVQDEIKATKKKAQKAETKAVPAVNAATPMPAPTPISFETKTSYEPKELGTRSLPSLAGVRVTLGGYVAAESVFRQRNEVADMGAIFNAIPYPFSPLYHEHEFHASARGSRLSLLAEGNIDAAHHLAGYFEMDWLGVGETSNYTESNSWSPRLRQAYLTYDDAVRGFYILAGQAWSLLTPHKVGITPRQENDPLTIDYNQVVGFDFTRNWQVRFVKDFDKTLWLGVSIENPAALTASGNIPGNVNNILVNFSNVGGGGGFLTGVAVTTDQAPDIILKAVLDPGWGHYEVFGIQRFFTDSTFCSSVMPTGCTLNVIDRKTSYGTGVGGSVLLPVIPRYVDLQGSIMYGTGIGRYGAGQLPDVTIAADGSLAPITALHVFGGVVVHPREGLDVYAYGGIEQARARFFDQLGYGNPAFDNSGCTITTASSFSSGTTPTCVANNKQLAEVTVGFWQDLYKGHLGRFAFGAQYEYIRREAFEGVGGAPATDNNVFYTSFRYYPF